MDFHKLLSVADSNKTEAEYESAVKRYSTQLPPPKKLPKSGVQSGAIKQFLEKRKAEEERKAREARLKKEELLALREMTKGRKKAKIMASRTKDNDFSKIKLSEDELEAKKKREEQLLKLQLNDKVARMKARIELEEKEKMLPKKRKRKSKHDGAQDDIEDHTDHYEHSPTASNVDQHSGQNSSKGPPTKKPARPPPQDQNLSFMDLLKVAAKKQYEPVALPVVKNDDDDARPLTKKARRLLQEEENRVRRKMAAAAEKNGEALISSIPDPSVVKQLPKIVKKKPVSDREHSNPNVEKHLKKRKDVNNRFEGMKKPTVVHIQKDAPVIKSQKPLAPKPSVSQQNNVIKKKSENVSNGQMRPSMMGGSSKSCEPRQKAVRQEVTRHKSMNNTMKASGSSMKKKEGPEKRLPPAKEKVTQPRPEPVANGQPLLNDQLIAEIENRIRSQVQKELEEKFLKQNLINAPNSQQNNSQKLPGANSQFRTNSEAKHVKPSSADRPKLHTESSVKGAVNDRLAGQKPPPKSAATLPVGAKHDLVRKSIPPVKEKLPPKPVKEEKPRKPAFHPNPYLEPPRRLLESRRPEKPVKRIVESDDDDDDEDEEMNDFIDDGPLQDEPEDYSKYIKEIFGYDRSRYLDDDDDDVIESSFVEQMKEEVRSARIGFEEDLEDIRKEQEMLKRKKLKGKTKLKGGL